MSPPSPALVAALMAGLSAVSLMRDGLRRRHADAVALAVVAAGAMLVMAAG